MGLESDLRVQIAGLVVLLAASAFFSMSETALISASRLRIRALKEKGSKRAALLDRLVHDPERLITTILVGNNIVNIAASVLSAVIAQGLFGSSGAAIATGAMVFLVLVFGEVTPKTLAVRYSMGIALAVAWPMSVMEVVLSPLVWLFSGIANRLLFILGAPRRRHVGFITEEEIKLMLRVGEEQGSIEGFERKVIGEVFRFTETKASRVMTPRDQIAFVDKEASLAEALETVNKSGYSRILVADRSLDHVLGFIHAKDLLRLSDAELKVKKAAELRRKVLIARDDVDTDDLLVSMQRLHTQIAVLQDARGETMGLLTVEDLLEELVGEIHDEFDLPPPEHMPGAQSPERHQPVSDQKPP
ncbi:MAG: HlyC/CorC family transporter [Euryarchaeota archaeon]|nr:HlyC/CorC family transporter [Euryarchaeota archaeon]